MNARLFWKALIVQLIVVAIPFAILGLALDEDFFEDWGWLVGPVVWLACSAITGRILSLPLAYVLFDAECRIIDWNPAAERIFGYSKEDILGHGPPFDPCGGRQLGPWRLLMLGVAWLRQRRQAYRA